MGKLVGVFICLREVKSGPPDKSRFISIILSKSGQRQLSGYKWLASDDSFVQIVMLILANIYECAALLYLYCGIIMAIWRRSLRPSYDIHG